MLKRKFVGSTVACAMILNTLLAVPFATSAAETKFEFEDGTQTGSASVLSEQSGYSGTGYVFLQDNSDTISVTVTVPETGMYELKIGYAAVYGDKVQGLEINGANQGNVSFPEGKTFEEVKFGTVKLQKGDNTVTIVGSWGWTLFDYVSIAAAEIGDLKCSNALSDKDATKEAQGLMNYMATVYGDYIISGQQEIYGGGHNNDYEWEFEYLKDLSGKYPAIRGFDLMNYNSLYGWDDGTTERIIEWVNDRGGIATASWHINVPVDMDSYNVGDKVDWGKATYSDKTNFVPSKILEDKNSKEYQYFNDAVDLLAAELKKLQDAGVPLLFRPFHEAEGAGGETGSWFWWGKDGSATYKALWKFLYEKLTVEYDLHNIIWEFNSYTYANSKNWYPGDEYVDIVGYDKYNASANNPNESAISSTFFNLVDMYGGSGKIVALTECDTVPSIDAMLEEGAYWAYFCPWYEGDDTSGKFVTLFNNKDTLKKIYQSDAVITLDELPDYKSYEYTGEQFVPVPTEPTEPTDPPAPTEPPKEGHAKLTEELGYVQIDFPEAVGEAVYLVVDLGDEITYANGGLGGSVEIDGEYYWVNTPWEATKSGAVKVDMTKPFNVTLGTEEVEDEAIIAEAIEKIQKQTSFQGQVWWADIDGEAASASDVTITDAYLLTAGNDPGEDPTEPTDPPVQEDVVQGTVKETTDGVAITLPQAVGETLYLQVDLATGVTFANGCVAANVDVEGTPYWVAVQWQTSGSGDIEIDMTDVYEVSLDGEKVTNEEIVAAAIAGLQELKNLTAQVWWVNDASGEQVDNSEAVITGAYIKSSGSGDAGVVYGDTDCSGKVDILDIIVLNKALLGGGSLTDEGAVNADVDNDGKPSFADSLNIMKFLVKLGDLPVEKA